MSEPVWLPLGLVLDIHAEQLAIFGGATGLRDQGALESALDRPRNKWGYGVTDMAELAAAYSFGLSRNHPFVDGNKRMAFAGMLVFLGLNGFEFETSEEDATAMMLALAAGEVSEDSLARWIRDRSPA
jgi:death on curing protein